MLLAVPNSVVVDSHTESEAVSAQFLPAATLLEASEALMKHMVNQNVQILNAWSQ